MQESQKIRSRVSSKQAIELEDLYGAKNYAPLPVVLSKGEGVNVWDPEGNQYYDFLSAYSALNQGHCHPRLVAVMQEQAAQLTLASRAFYNDWLGKCEQYLSETFNYEKVLMMNSGVEAVETAVKLARRWGYRVKGIKESNAKIVTAENNFHGRTTGIISFSTDNSSRDDFGPFLPGFISVPYDDVDALEKELKNPDVCAFMVEPIQGEAGVITPSDGYLKKVRALCDQYNVLFIADEIQTGLGRTGKLLCTEHEQVRADIITLGKALSGGMMPVSAVLADDDIMLLIQAGEHGSTFGGNPLGSRLAIESIKVIIEENLIENAEVQGKYFRDRMRKIDSPLIKTVRGKGLLNAVVIDEKSGHDAKDICLTLMHKGLLAKQTHKNTIRFTPPLIINDMQMKTCCDIIENAILELK